MANILEASDEASRFHGHAMARPTGLIVTALHGGRFYAWTGRAWTPWVPTLRDIKAEDWETGPLNQIMATLASLNPPSDQAVTNESCPGARR